MKYLIPIAFTICFLGWPALQAQTFFVKVSPITKYNFRITNYAPVDLWVKISGMEPFKLQAGYQHTLSSKQIKEFTTMELDYTYDQFQAVNTYIQSKDDKLITQKIITSVGYQAVIKAAEVTSKDYSGEFWTKLFAYGLLGIQTSKIEQERLKLEQLAMVNAALYRAASKEEVNRYSKDFEPILLKKYTQSGVLLSPKVKVELTFPLKREDLNEYWEKESSRASWGASVAYRLGGEV